MSASNTETKRKQKGQAAVEYILLVGVCIAAASLLMLALRGSGAVHRVYSGIANVIGNSAEFGHQINGDFHPMADDKTRKYHPVQGRRMGRPTNQ